MIKKNSYPIIAFLACGLFVLLLAASSHTAEDTVMKNTLTAGTDSYLGEVMIFAGNFCPRNYAACEGQLLPVAQNTALFSLLGTTYGGDGRTTFGLPDLRGRTPVGVGTGPGLPQVRDGQKGGTDQVMRGRAGAANNPNLGMRYCICTVGIYPSRS